MELRFTASELNFCNICELILFLHQSVVVTDGLFEPNVNRNKKELENKYVSLYYPLLVFLVPSGGKEMHFVCVCRNGFMQCNGFLINFLSFAFQVAKQFELQNKNSRGESVGGWRQPTRIRNSGKFDLLRLIYFTICGWLFRCLVFVIFRFGWLTMYLAVGATAVTTTKHCVVFRLSHTRPKKKTNKNRRIQSIFRTYRTLCLFSFVGHNTHTYILTVE